MKESKYLPRLVDKKIDDYLSVCGALLIEGPKWCGKTLTSSKHANSITYMDDTNNKELAKVDPKLIFDNNIPQLIDEWHLVPEIWDAVRRECDERSTRGNFILTGSTRLLKKDEKEKIHHSGTGRIIKFKMYTMSLYESGDSSGKASIQAMYDGVQKNYNTGDINIENIAYLIIRGGWPENIGVSKDKASILPNSYIESILDSDMNENSDTALNRNKMLLILRSLARNETSLASNTKILNDIDNIKGNNKEDIESKNTLKTYLDILDRLHLIENQEAYDINFRSSNRVGKQIKRHLTDPSLAAACLRLNTDKLLSDMVTFGLLFEALVERDLRIYINYLDGHLYHFRDNVSGLEVDAILEFPDGEYAAIEIKLGYSKVEEAKENLIKFKNSVNKKPKFMAIIVGKCIGIVKDPTTGIYILPITALKP